MTVSLNPSHTGSTAHRYAVPAAPSAEGAAFDLSRYAELTYQEYTYCPHSRPVNDWLRDTLGI